MLFYISQDHIVPLKKKKNLYFPPSFLPRFPVPGVAGLNAIWRLFFDDSLYRWREVHCRICTLHPLIGGAIIADAD